MPHADHPVSGLPTPDPSYGPARVVAVQLEALADNDTPVTDAGIKTAYNFASPANRRSTGPLGSFRQMVKGPRYAPMVDHVEATTGPLERDDETAEQRVTLTGPGGCTATYRFGLSVQSGGRWDGCWLTDRVLLD